jgi:hypothetical protein
MADLEVWMQRAIRSGSWQRFDDYHVDGGAAARDVWVARALEEFAHARSIRDQRFPGFALLLGFSLERVHTALVTVAALNEALDSSPPSIYVFGARSDLLADALSDASEVSAPPFAPTGCQAYMRKCAEGSRAGSLLLLDAG